MDQRITDYIQKARQAGLSDSAIRDSLRATGWSNEAIEEALGGSQGASVQGVLSAEESAFVHRWSWGGFILNFVYFLANNVYSKAGLYFAGGFVPGLNLFLLFKCGLKAREIVWQNGSWPDFATYRRRQHTLDIIAVVLLLITIVLAVLSAVLIAIPAIQSLDSAASFSF